jgi:hypothetical protein
MHGKDNPPLNRTAELGWPTEDQQLLESTVRQSTAAAFLQTDSWGALRILSEFVEASIP